MEHTMLSLTAVLLILVVTFIAAQYFKLQWSRSQYPPGPMPLPIIGNLWTLRFELRDEVLMQLAKTYGNIFTVWLGQEPAVVLNGCKSLRNGLITHSEELSERPITPLFERLAGGKGVAFTNGPTWRRQRRFGLMTMRNLGLGKKILEQKIQTEAQHLVEFFATTKGKAIDPGLNIAYSVANVIAAVMVGHRFPRGDKELHQFITTVYLTTHFLSTMWARLYDSFPWLMQHLPGPQHHFFECGKLLEVFVEREIESHKENGIKEEPQDLIDFYLSQISKETGEGIPTFDQEHMVRLVTEMFAAGIETTVNTLRWALLYMMTQPEIQEKVQKELDDVLGEKQVVEYEDRKRLPYTNAVIHEIQRFGNIQSVGAFRQLMKDTSLEGYHLKKGTMIICNLSSSMYDPNHWEKPHQFNPGHFLDKEGNFVTNEAFLPFSGGHRVCLGELLARTELIIFFSTLLRNFTFRLPDGVKEVDMSSIFGDSLKPHPYKICAIPR